MLSKTHFLLGFFEPVFFALFQCAAITCCFRLSRHDGSLVVEEIRFKANSPAMRPSSLRELGLGSEGMPSSNLGSTSGAVPRLAVTTPKGGEVKPGGGILKGAKEAKIEREKELRRDEFKEKHRARGGAF